MNHISLGKTGLSVSEIALGCMRIADMSPTDAEKLIVTAIEGGINFFDHADIYGGGMCEEVFGKAIKSLNIKREDIIIQTKCGIRNGFFDFSSEHIINSVEGSLKRLGTDYVDVLLLHRPDTLFEPEEVALAFDKLRAGGKVRHFGVSNQNPSQMELLSSAMSMPIAANQLQFGLAHTGMIDCGLNSNMTNDPSINRDGGTLEYCRLKNITIQPWSPFQKGFFGGVFFGAPEYEKLCSVLKDIANRYGVTEEGMAIAWILRHPAKMQPILGTTNAERVKGICRASDIKISREEWYEIYRSAGNILP